MVALVLMTAFVLVERRSSAPLVRLAIFQHRPLTGANVAIAANAGGFGAMMFIATLYLQQVLGYSALGTGVAFVPLALSACAGGPLARQVRRRFGGLAAPALAGLRGTRRFPGSHG
jgi:hypothetical protein